MPKAVAILEGDSTGLVKSINDAKGAMQKLEGEGRKLTDQLRDVADEADKAAGNLVNKIGGGTAIKAIAGVTAGFAAAQTALGAFSGSMQAFYSTQGEQGAKAMADIDMALSKLQAQFFTAVMGTDNLEEATQTLLTVINFLADALNAILWPIEQVSKFIRMLADLGDIGAKNSKKHADELLRMKDVQAKLTTSYTTNEGAIKKNQLAIESLTGATKDLRKEQLQQAINATDAIANEVKLAEKYADIAEYKRRVAADTAENDRQARKIASMQLAEGKISADEFNDKMNEYYENLQKSSRRAARDAVMVMSEETKVQLAALGAQRQVLVKELLLGTEEVKAAVTSTPTGGTRSDADAAGAGLPTMEEILAKREERLKAEEELILFYGGRIEGLTREQALRQAEDNKRIQDEKHAAALNRLKETEKAEADGRVAREKADAEWEAKKAERAALAEERKKKEIEDIESVAKEYGQMAAQQLVDGQKASKIAEKMARKALGGQIAALGDKAMAEAAIMAAALNPMAIPMGAAGIAAYAAAAALGSDAKKATSSTPAVATAPQQMNTNVSYNLQVDAAFANGESIARQFSMAQREAQRRGMMPAGVF